ncbi:hypothetical protein PFISCL1PPCAC_12584, partial [Pristionchus fissidentatus]
EMGEDCRRFVSFIRDLSAAMDLAAVEPDMTDSKCGICFEEMTATGDNTPRIVICCGQTFCSQCELGVINRAAETKNESVKMEATCPYCRKPLSTKSDVKFIKELREQEKRDDADRATEIEGIKCSACERLTHTPHARFVCLTCRMRTGEKLLTGKEKGRKEVKEFTMCPLCIYRHSEFHRKRKNEKCELRPLSQLIGYTSLQVQRASDLLLEKIKNQGYVPQSLSVLYSLWRDVAGGDRFDTSTINLLIEVLHECKKFLRERLQRLPDCELKEVAQRDFVFFFESLVADLEKWCSGAKQSDKDLMKDAEWAAAVSQLLYTMVGWIDAIIPTIMDECWESLEEIVLKLVPDIVRRLPVDHTIREVTIDRLYQTCCFIDRSWDDLAFGRLIKREMLCIRIASNPAITTSLLELNNRYEAECKRHRAKMLLRELQGMKDDEAEFWKDLEREEKEGKREPMGEEEKNGIKEQLKRAREEWVRKKRDEMV